MIVEPPPAYVHPYTGELRQFEMSAAAVAAYCARLGLPDALACAIVMEGQCIIVIPDLGIGGVHGAAQEVLKRHELAHCNGWRGTPQ